MRSRRFQRYSNCSILCGCIITIDAMGTPTKIATQIISQGADYILCLKENHPTLYQQVKETFEQAIETNFEGLEFDYDQRVEAGHHRREMRKVWVMPAPQLGGLYQQSQWARLQSVVMVYRRRYLWNKVTEETQFFLTSLPCNAQRLGRAIRCHWGLENQLHWVLDVTLRCDPAEVSSAKERAPREGEDDSRIHQGHAPENFTLLRRLAISALNQETSSPRSVRQKAIIGDDELKLHDESARQCARFLAYYGSFFLALTLRLYPTVL